MPIIVQRNDRAPVVMTMRAALKQLPADTDEGPILTGLGHGQPVSVALADGTRALWQLQPTDGHTEPPGGRERSIDRRYTAACELLLSLEIHVSCFAPGEQAARRVINGVLAHNQPPPADFELWLGDADMRRLFERIRLAVREGNPRHLPVDSVRINRVVAVPLLEQGA